MNTTHHQTQLRSHTVVAFMSAFFCLFLSLAIQATAQLPGVIDLANNEQNAVIYGDDSYGNFSMYQGIKMADVNGDGVKDLLISACLADGKDNARVDSGEVYIYYGGAGFAGVKDIRGTLGPKPDVIVYGAAANYRMGRATMITGDVNHDGIDDILLGMDDPAYSYPGDVYIIFGSGTLPGEIDLANNEQDVIIKGDDIGDFLACTYNMVLGDVNGDGILDIILGAPGGDRPGDLPSGEAYVIYGRTSFPGTIDLAAGAQDVIIYGYVNLSLTAFGALAAGDVNGDGNDDIILGSWNYGGTGYFGAVHVVYGSGSMPAVVDLQNGGGNVLIIGDLNDMLTSEHALITGDINGDGLDDIIMGVPHADGAGNTREGAGEVSVVYGSANISPVINLANGEQDVVVYGDPGDTSITENSTYLGGPFSLKTGDLNGDGIDDLIMGAFAADGPDPFTARRSGEAYVVYGGDNIPPVIKTEFGEEDVTIYSATGGQLTFYGVQIGDLNGDGIKDLFLGEWLAEGGEGHTRTDSGEAFVVMGRNGPLPDEIDLAKDEGDVAIYGAVADDHLTEIGAMACGDLNGDGIDDIIVGSQRFDNPEGARTNGGAVYIIFGKDNNIPPVADVIYVDKDATGANNGTSWQDAFIYLQDALAAFASGDEIWVAAGTYYPDEGNGQTDNDRSSTFYLAPFDAVKLYGGFDGTDGAGGGLLETNPSQRDWETNVTVLSGDLAQDDVGFTNNDENAYHVISISSNTDDRLIDGFTITAGNANKNIDPDFTIDGYGGGLVFDSAPAPGGFGNKSAFYNCTFTNNHARSSGGGAFVSGKTAIFHHCIFDGNKAFFSGGGISSVVPNSPLWGSGAGLEMYDCVISNNTANRGGGIINRSEVNDGSDNRPILINCLFLGNSATSGGGAMSNEGTLLGECDPSLINCVFSGNSAQYGGAVANTGDLGICNPSFTNCTFSGNKAINQGNEIYNDQNRVLSCGECKPLLTNCIVWNDSSIYNDTATPSYASCDIKGSGGSSSWLASLGTDLGGNIDADPLFVTPPVAANAPTTSGDVHLQEGSPCIDTGTTAGAPTADFEGDARDAAPDMGADEYLPDTDGDGEPDITDGCPDDPAKTAPGACGCGVSDADTDTDGVPDCNDNCPNDPAKTAPGACGCGRADVDTDGDGSPNCNDGCPNDAAKFFPGACGCGVADTDADGDGTPDCIDGCPADPLKTDPGRCGCGMPDSDVCGGGANLPPEADAGENRVIFPGAMAELDGSDSSDPDGAIAAYLWEQTEGPTVTLSDASAIQPTFTMPADALGETLTFQLTVTDNDGATDTDSVTLTAGDEACPTEPDNPVLISPADGATGVSLTPILQSGPYSDPGDCSTHFKTRWQISDQTDFSGLTYNANTFYDELTAHQVTKKVLKPNTTYYWRVKYQGDHGIKSEWSEVFTFATGPEAADNNGNGLPDGQEPGTDTDVNENGIPDVQEANLRVMLTADGNAIIGLGFADDIQSIAVETMSADEITDLENMPGGFVYGLIAFRVMLANPGATVSFTVYLPDAAPADAAWYKYDTVNGWYDFTGQVIFSPNRKAITFQLTDGGTGDADGVVNGVIVDPAGLTAEAEDGSSTGHGGGGSSCFVDAITN